MDNKMKLVFLLLALIIGCDCGEDKLSYKKAELLDIRRDDDAELRYKSGEVIAYNDVYNYKIYTGNYQKEVKMPFVNWESCTTKGVLRAWIINTTEYYEPIEIYLPRNYEIPFFND